MGTTSRAFAIQFFWLYFSRPCHNVAPAARLLFCRAVANDRREFRGSVHMAALAGERPVALFQGYDSVTDNGKQSAVTGASKATGAESTSYFSICKTASELAKSLQIDASLSASYAGLGSVDANMS